MEMEKLLLGKQLQADVPHLEEALQKRWVVEQPLAAVVARMVQVLLVWEAPARLLLVV
jgi:hypothetical protein